MIPPNYPASLQQQQQQQLLQHQQQLAMHQQQQQQQQQPTGNPSHGMHGMSNAESQRMLQEFHFKRHQQSGAGDGLVQQQASILFHISLRRRRRCGRLVRLDMAHDGPRYHITRENPGYRYWG